MFDLPEMNFLAVNIGKVSKGAKIMNQYYQVPHLTQDTNGKGMFENIGKNCYQIHVERYISKYRIDILPDKC